MDVSNHQQVVKCAGTNSAVFCFLQRHSYIAGGSPTTSDSSANAVQYSMSLIRWEETEERNVVNTMSFGLHFVK